MKKAALGLLLLTLVSLLSANESQNCSLDEYLTEHGVTREQNSGHINVQPGTDQKAKRFQEILRNNPDVHNIAEIGFCLGHSSDVFLSTRSNVQMVSFDMMYHWFNDLGKEYIDLKYPGKHQLFKGDSLQTVPQFFHDNPGMTFDLIFIDGGHEYHVALGDIINMRHLARPDTILIVDDTNFKPVNDAWKQCVSEGFVEEIERNTTDQLGWLIGRYLQFDE